MQIDKNTLHKEEGTTLIELLVSLSIFAVFVAVAVGGFVQALANQRLVLQLMAATDNMSFALEQMMREMRVSTDFEVGDSSIQFTRIESGIIDDEKYSIEYQYDAGRKAIQRTKTKIEGGIPMTPVTDLITASNVEVTDFVVKDITVPGGAPRITIVVGVSASDKGRSVTNHIQTTVSGRLF